MAKLKQLSWGEIEKLASGDGVKKIAVENFLGTMYNNTEWEALANLDMDARLYRWNTKTVNAIRRGILKSAKKK